MGLYLLKLIILTTMILSPLQNKEVTSLSGNKIISKPIITQKFGLNPSIYKQFGLSGHNGTDFRAPVGTPVYSPMDGEVRVENQGKAGYGLHIKIRGGDREIVLGHMSKVMVETGDKIKIGELIALSGNTGFSTGPHLHFGLRNIIPEDGVNIWQWKVKDASNGFAGYKDVDQWTVTWRGTLTKIQL